MLNDIWKDPFYYGTFEYGDITVDLTEKNPHFEPLITKEEYDILIERYYGQQPHKGRKEVKDEHKDVMPLDDKFVFAADGSVLSFNIPNKKRHYAKLEELRKANPSATLRDVVRPSQIHYRCVNRRSEFHGIAVTFDVVESAIANKLKTFRVDDEHYEEYRKFMQ